MRAFIKTLLASLLTFYNDSVAAIARRGDEVSTIVRSGVATSTVTALTFFTPSSGAEPVPITSQSQLVTSYIPVLTICPLTVTETAPALPLPMATSNITTRGTAVSKLPVSSGASILRRQALEDANAPYANSSIPTSTLTACSVFYSPTTTSICHTTLSPLASPVIPITDCYQKVTFSTDHGFAVVSSTTAHYGNVSISVVPSIETLTSYYVAPWQYVYTGVPADAVDVVVCSISAGVKDCTTTAEDWAPGTGWIKATNTIPLTLGAPVTGPAEVIVHPTLPTYTVPEGQTTTMSLSTDLPVVTSHATTTINRSPATTTAAATSLSMSTSLSAPTSLTTLSSVPTPPISSIPRISAVANSDSTTTSTRTSTRTRVLTVQTAALGSGIGLLG